MRSAASRSWQASPCSSSVWPSFTRSLSGWPRVTRSRNSPQPDPRQNAEQLVRVSPKLTVPERRAGRARGKSDAIDALAVARAALREPDLPRPQPGEQVHREIKLLVDHRDDLVDERRRTQQRLRWHLHELDPTLVVPLRR